MPTEDCYSPALKQNSEPHLSNRQMKKLSMCLLKTCASYCWVLRLAVKECLPLTPVTEPVVKWFVLMKKESCCTTILSMCMKAISYMMQNIK